MKKRRRNTTYLSRDMAVSFGLSLGLSEKDVEALSILSKLESKRRLNYD